MAIGKLAVELENTVPADKVLALIIEAMLSAPTQDRFRVLAAVAAFFHSELKRPDLGPGMIPPG